MFRSRTHAVHRTLALLCSIALLVTSIQNVSRAGDRGADEPRTPNAIYGQGVRETNKLSPEEEKAGFHLPTGFVAELVASEPQIAKPLNMAFDSQGRLWITDTTEYPYPAPVGTPAHDSIKTLVDKDGNGSLETVTTFADDLNIPIGILPVEDGVICFSIPNIMHLKDNDGDGRCDERKILLGPFDTTRDTHGMVNAMRRGEDGWIYACHGFNNQSHVKAADGSQIDLISGNTFRFRPDGSHVEQFTHGQVNPFGMTSDDWGNWYTADCHSKPVTLLVRGGHYESFGRPHEGLGFVPSVMGHLHGSTAICGINYYLANEYPIGFRHKFYSGNVMTSRINCNRLQVDRDHIQLVEEPDFMTSDDPWFRPVDLQLGADGALYVADFYNKIIGHYEVRLDHPERDRNSGRIWRIVYRGQPSKTDPLTHDFSGPPGKTDPLTHDFSGPPGRPSRLQEGDALPGIKQTSSTGAKQSTSATAKPLAELLSPEHLTELAHENTTVRQFAIQRLSSATLTPAQLDQLRELVLPKKRRSESLRMSALWTLHQRQLDSESILATALTDMSPHMLVAVLRAWEDRPADAPLNAEPSSSKEFLRQTARTQLKSDTPQVALAAASALGRHGTADYVVILLDESASRSADAAIVPHAMRIAIKSLLQGHDVSEHVLAQANLTAMAAPLKAHLASLLPAVNTPRAASALLYLVAGSGPAMSNHRQAALLLACKHMQPEFAEPVVKLLREFESDSNQSFMDVLSPTLDQQTTLAMEAIATLRAGRHPLPGELKRLLDNKVTRLVSAIEQQLASPGAAKPIDWQESNNKLWPQQERARKGESPQTRRFISSFPLGETYVGTMSTAPFACPNELCFWIAGHDGPPNQPAGGKNVVRLVDAETGQTLQQATPPRHDAAEQVCWQSAKWEGQPVRLQCIDGDNGTAFAWFAVEGFSLPQLNPSPIEGGIVKLAKLIPVELSPEAKPRIEKLFDAPNLSDIGRARLAAGYVTSRGWGLAKLLIEMAEQRGQAAAVPKEIAIGGNVAYLKACKELATLLAAHMTLSQQTQFARSLIATPEGRRLLIELVDDGRLATQSLRNLTDLLGSTPNDADSQRLSQLSQSALAVPSEAETALVARVGAFQLKAANSEKGKLLYEKNCANCHKLRGAGQLVGPQLDGVGPRGPERLVEDILLPNRNVDKAFRLSSLLLEDDRVMVGLVRETGADELQVVGTDGKALSIRADEIATRNDTTRSLMPDNFGELLSDQELSSLLQFIMQ